MKKILVFLLLCTCAKADKTIYISNESGVVVTVTGRSKWNKLRNCEMIMSFGYESELIIPNDTRFITAWYSSPRLSSPIHVIIETKDLEEDGRYLIKYPIENGATGYFVRF
jgi:hypothetical protein